MASDLCCSGNFWLTRKTLPTHPMLNLKLSTTGFARYYVVLTFISVKYIYLIANLLKGMRAAFFINILVSE